MKKKSKGGKRTGAGRPKMPDKMETVSIRVRSTDVQKWGGRDNLRHKLCEFVAFPVNTQQVAFYDPRAGVGVRDLKPDEVLPPAKIALQIKGAPEAQESPVSKFEQAISETARSSILKQIEAIKSEKIPPERNTPIGKKSWAIDQQKRISELEKQLQ